MNTEVSPEGERRADAERSTGRRWRSFPRSLRAAAVLGVFALSPLASLSGAQTCSFARVLHQPCPGCGMTRATMLLLHGDVAGSLRMHPLAVPAIVAYALVAIAATRTTLRVGAPWELWRTRFGRVAAIVTLVTFAAMVVFWLLRMRGMFGGPVAV